MAYTVDILNAKKVAEYGLLSKIQIGGKTYEIKDLIARENIGTLSAGLDAVAADLQGKIDALSYVKATGVFADDAAVKSYVDSQVGAINKFDVHVMGEGEELPAASADTMYILYLKPDKDAASGTFVEYITIRSGEEGAYTYAWEAIGSTKMDVTGFVTKEALEETLKDYTKTADFGDLAMKDEADLDLKALAHKDSATGTVAGQTITGVKATGTSTGSIAVTAKYDAADATLSKGDYTPAGTVTSDFGHATAAAELVMSKHAPEGSVSVALSGNSFNAITGVGTQASFTEGEFTAATLDYAAADYSVAKEGIVGSVDENECLVFTAAGLEAISASKINSFSGGAKAADTFVANSLPTMAAQVVGVQSATFTGVEHDCVSGVNYDKASMSTLTFAGTKAEGALVTGVSYQKADIGSATFTGATVDIAASFAGTEGDISVAGKCHDYAVKTAQFNGAAIELAVGDIAVAEKSVTVQ